MERSASIEPQDGDPQPTRRRRGRAQQMQQDQQPQFQQPQHQQPEQQGALSSTNQGGLSNTAGQAGQVLGNPPAQAAAPQGGGKKEALKLRLDLNLDVDVQIKARVHGDVTLSLL